MYNGILQPDEHFSAVAEIFLIYTTHLKMHTAIQFMCIGQEQAVVNRKQTVYSVVD